MKEAAHHLEDSMEQHDTSALPTDSVTPAAPWLRIHTLGQFHIDWVDPVSGQITPLPFERLRGQNAGSALGLLKALLSSPGRFATRAWLTEQFWPTSRHKAAEARLNDVVSALRTLLRPKGCREMFVHFVYDTSGRGAGYRLDNYPQVWCDADAFEWYIKHAFLLDQRGQDSTACWEHAYQLAERGVYLPEHLEEDWSRPRRDHVSGLWRDCIHRWTQLLRQMGQIEEAILRLRSYWLEHPTDEDALRPLLEMLGERERFGEADACYEKAQAALAEDGYECDARTTETMEVVRASRIKRLGNTERAGTNTFLQSERLSPSVLAKHFPIKQSRQGYPPPPSRQEFFTLSVSEQTRFDTFLQHSAIFCSPENLDANIATPFPARQQNAFSETLECLARVLAKPIQLDHTVLLALEKLVEDCWRLRPDILGIISPELLQLLFGHLQQVTSLLARSLLSSTRLRLCTLASELTQMVGWTLYEMRAFSQALAYYELAVAAAREAENPLLEAIALARMSRVLRHCAQEEMLLPTLQHARSLLKNEKHSPVFSWLCAEEALAYAREGQAYESLKMLEDVTEVFLPENFEGDLYWVGFEANVKAGFFGSCYTALQQFEQAETCYREALAQISQTSRINPRHRRSLLVVNLATLLVEREAIEEACQLAQEALLLTNQSQSPLVFQHLVQLRKKLDPWKTLAAVKTLDATLLPAQTSLLTKFSTMG